MGLSQREVARQTGRDVSWVSRRLDLVCGLPDPLLQAVREGTLSPWAATRILAPLARANTDHASSMLDALKATPLSTRELARWFEHYQRSPRSVRDRLVAQPRLFIESLAAANEIRADRHVRAGPEAQWERDLRHLQALIGRLHPALPQMAYLKSAFERAQGNVSRMGELLTAEYEIPVSYSTFTRWVRDAGLRAPPPERAGFYAFAPGDEMQHDTSPHRVTLGDTPVTAQCAGLVLAYSRRLFIQSITPASDASRPASSCSRRCASWTAPVVAA